jgi:DNA-binding MarR family transcriptional regulator
LRHSLLTELGGRIILALDHMTLAETAELAQELGGLHSRVGVYHTLRRLRQKGWVESRECEYRAPNGGSRPLEWRLTPAGTALAEAIQMRNIPQLADREVEPWTP